MTLKLSELSDFIESFEYEDFYSFHSKNEPQYETLSMKNMSISNSVIRARTLEAKDLTNIVPKASSSRSIPQRFRLRIGKQNHHDELYTLSPITSRISKRDTKVSLSDLVLWVKEVLEVLKQRGHGGFLDSFAKPVELNEILKNGHKITAIFIDVSDVEEMLANGDISLVIEEVSGHNINYVDMNVKKQNRLFHVLRNPLIVFNDAFKYRFYFEKKKIKYNKKTIRLESNVLNKIFIKNMKGDKPGEIRGSLLQHLNEYKTFSAVFDTPNYAYFSNSCYEDKQLIDSLDSIISLLDDSLDFLNVKSEKEKPHDQNISQFPENSLFRIVEDIYIKIPGVVLVCDDMGNEWADHIVFNSDVSEIIFIHSKFSQESSGASAFHEVVSQALKNIALVHASKDVFFKKI